jgi:hypothetical protein
MYGVTYVGYVPLPWADPAWEVRAAAGFNGDRKPDIVWRKPTTGGDQLWIMNGTTYVDFAALPSVAGANWTIVAAADFNGDGRRTHPPSACSPR